MERELWAKFLNSKIQVQKYNSNKYVEKIIKSKRRAVKQWRIKTFQGAVWGETSKKEKREGWPDQ